MSEEVADDTDFITSLQSHIASLQHRVKELEAVNANLSLQLANCTCHEKETRLGGSSKCLNNSIGKSRVSESGNISTRKKKVEDRRQGHITSITYPHGKRYIALKVMYFGKRFYGFASEAQMDPTIESEIFRALEKTRLLVGDKKESQYSRCGRTDKGVSSFGQVIALFLRSNIKETLPDHQSPIQMVSNQQYVGEIDYVRVLNRVLPDDIRVLGWSPVPVGFSARFSCLSREYKYFFWGKTLDLLSMETAGRKLIGEHDFRNFCKMDALNVHNYRRHITSFEISPCDVRFEGNQLWTISLKGSAFLWHQVRCMVAILFMIGQGFESPDVIDALLDIVKTPRKPQYIMASELPLVLQSCYFEDLKFYCSPDAGQALRAHLVKQCQTYQLQAAIFQEALLNCLPISSDQSPVSNGVKKNKSTHIPLSSRPTEPSYAERQAKLNLRT